MSLVADVADAAAVRGMFDTIRARHGPLDVSGEQRRHPRRRGHARAATALGQLLARQVAEQAAGGPIRTHVDITVQLPDAVWHRVLAVHLDGTFFCTREALRLMGERDGGGLHHQHGLDHGNRRWAGAPAYCAAKAGILGLHARAGARGGDARHPRERDRARLHRERHDVAPRRDPAVPRAQTPMGRFGEPDDSRWAASTWRATSRGS